MEEARRNHRLAAEAIRGHTKGYLQHGLGQAIDADGYAHQQRCGGRQVLGIQRKYRQDHEHAQHAHGKDAGQCRGGAALERRHGS
jgi:hypothetical protein